MVMISALIHLGRTQALSLSRRRHIMMPGRSKLLPEIIHRTKHVEYTHFRNPPSNRHGGCSLLYLTRSYPFSRTHVLLPSPLASPGHLERARTGRPANGQWQTFLVLPLALPEEAGACTLG
jgi:hypothetical protein